MHCQNFSMYWRNIEKIHKMVVFFGETCQNRPALMQKFSRKEGEVTTHAHIIFLIPPAK